LSVPNQTYDRQFCLSRTHSDEFSVWKIQAFMYLGETRDIASNV